MVYATDAAVSDQVRVAAKAPDGSHKPIVYPAAVLRDAKQAALANDFLAFAGSDAGLRIFARFGFEVE